MAVYSAAASTTATTPLAITWTGTQPTAGDKVVVAFAAFKSAGSPTITSVVDNGTSPTTFTLARASTDLTGGNLVTDHLQLWIYYGDAITRPSSGNYIVTVTFGSTISTADGGGGSYGGIATGNPAAVNDNNSASTITSVTTGSISPSGSGLYVAGFSDGSGANPATVTPTAPFSNRVTVLDGTTQDVGVYPADDINDSGAQNATWTVDSNGYFVSAIAFWANAAAAASPRRIARPFTPVARASFF